MLNGKIIDQIISAHNSSERKFLIFIAFIAAEFSNGRKKELKTLKVQRRCRRKGKESLSSYRTNNVSIKDDFYSLCNGSVC